MHSQTSILIIGYAFGAVSAQNDAGKDKVKRSPHFALNFPAGAAPQERKVKRILDFALNFPAEGAPEEGKFSAFEILR